MHCLATQAYLPPLSCKCKCIIHVCTYIIQLNKIGLKADAERPPELLRCAQSHEHLYGSRVSIDSPPTTPSTKKRGGLFNIFKKRKTAGKRQGKGERERGTEGEGGDSVEVGGRQEEDKSFLTSSVSMPNIACESVCQEWHCINMYYMYVFSQMCTCLCP